MVSDRRRSEQDRQSLNAYSITTCTAQNKQTATAQSHLLLVPFFLLINGDNKRGVEKILRNCGGHERKERSPVAKRKKEIQSGDYLMGHEEALILFRPPSPQRRVSFLLLSSRGRIYLTANSAGDLFEIRQFRFTSLSV